MAYAEEDTDEDLFERARLLQLQAEVLIQIAAEIREEARKLIVQTERTVQILAANRASRAK
jgi:hypothetical protein